MIIAAISTLWMLWWLIRLILAYDSSRHSASGLALAFVLIGLFPVLFFNIILGISS